METKAATQESVLVGGTEKKDKKKGQKERGTNLTPKGSKEFSTCFITFQRQIKRAARKWNAEIQASKSETK